MRHSRIQAFALGALLLAAACNDVTTSAPGPEPTAAAAPGTKLLGTITCHVDVASQTSRCGDLVPPGGASYNRFILDSVYWTLGTNGQFNSGGLAYFFNHIRNDLGQSIGIESGIADSVFAFVTSTTTTGGSGTVTPANHDGTRGFTAPSQAYWVWEGEVSPGGDTGTKIWTFNLPSTVTSWTYTIGVQTTVLHPTGWVEVGGITRIPLAGSTQLTAVVRDWTGTVDTGGTVTWTVTPSGGSVFDRGQQQPPGHLHGHGRGIRLCERDQGRREPAWKGDRGVLRGPGLARGPHPGPSPGLVNLAHPLPQTAWERVYTPGSAGRRSLAVGGAPPSPTLPHKPRGGGRWHGRAPSRREVLPLPPRSGGGGRGEGALRRCTASAHPLALPHFRTHALPHFRTLALSHFRTLALSHCRSPCLHPPGQTPSRASVYASLEWSDPCPVHPPSRPCTTPAKSPPGAWPAS